LQRNDERGYWLYERKHQSTESLFEQVASSTRYGKGVNLALVSSKSDIMKVLRHCPDGFHVEIKHSEPVFTIHIIRRVQDKGRDHTDEIKVVCAKTENPSLYLAISDYKPALFKSLFLKLVNHNYPLLARIFVRNIELRKLFDSLRAKNIETIIHRALYYPRYDDAKQVQDKTLKWTKLPYDRIFNLVGEQNGWIKKVTFKAYLESDQEGKLHRELKLEGSISGDLHFVIKGEFLSFRKYILDQMIDTVNTRVGYLKKRSDSASEKLPEPLVIRFKEPIFKGEDWNEKFLEIMSEMKNVSLTRYHQNPFVHISLVDYQDGSSYGIWIIAEDEINIIPQIRASVASMNRLVNHVYERISEGEITKYEPIAVGAEGY
jgi:hypothetical protein